MPPLAPTSCETTYWRSLDELAGTPEFRAFLEAEFPTECDTAGVSRRRWLQLMGASLALAGLAGCRWKKEEILPFAKRPANRVPGVPNRFATAMDLGGSALGLLVTSYDGRPIKIEGNPAHPQSRGATDVFAQAAILELYDPDRATGLVEHSGQDHPRSWSDFAAFAASHFGALKKDGGARLRVLSQASSSPTLAAMRARLLAEFPKARWVQYEPVSDDAQRAGATLAFGRPLRTQLALERARIIVSLDSDLLACHPAAVQYAREFAARRDPAGDWMSRLYVVESCLSVTGSMADHRLALRPKQIAALAEALEKEIRARLAQGASPAPAVAAGESKAARFLSAMAADLVALNRQGGHSVVVAGPRQPAEVHAVAHRLNRLLKNVGQTVWYTEEPDPDRPPHAEAIRALADEMHAGAVETLVVLGGNPVYDAPADVAFAKALARVPTRIYLGLYPNETARVCTWRLPQAHFLETWGDARSWDGTYSVVQPLIDPLYGGRSAIEVVAMLLGQQVPKGHDLVRETFRSIVKASDWEARWAKTLHDGVLEGSRFAAVAAEAADRPASGEPRGDFMESDWSNGQMDLIFCRDASVYDGRFANNGWLQEMPDPLTKLTWDNAALVSPATAAALGVENGTIVRLTLGGRSVEIPAYVMPGQAPGCVAVSLGYGRTAAGHVGGDPEAGVDPVGADVYPLRTCQAMEFQSGLSVEVTDRKVRLAMTQDHHAIDAIGLAGRAERLGALVREATLEHYREHPDFARHAVHHPPLESLWNEPTYQGYRWGMAIDLSKCIGCGACMVACQAENNVPVVGKERVLQGREMHWVRVDRYFRGDPDDPSVVHQVVACHHCENAPCEQVCPVAATVHSREGLNEMVYNRCVGTRYCANNCPYKVRRFNFFNYHKDLDAPENEVLKMLYNPEVTVRSRGVMEKCTYCVQRIQAAKIEAKNNRRDVRDGEIRTACQQVCPTGAIVFGDLNDPRSAVARAAASDRAYAMLAELNVKPRTSYLARIRNPNLELEGIA
ncbi:MAG: TAT-variant-translocated molybdopterin oxidoreductase [Thermoguttaceae bacterium]|jgi:molybdopterin-containing oxidoreductase family iron-sulfur binding subunit|nr:TAT-variant-translocated molybdopterin oxidoreductase [Thermoguttaceae bacterium]